MSDNFRYRYGDTHPVSVPFDSAFAVELGSMALIAGATTDVDADAGVAGKLYAANKTKWDTNEATTRAAFCALFAGVAMQSYDGTNTSAYGIKDGRLRIATRGVFEFTTASASYKVGDKVGPAKQSGNDLEDQKVKLVTADSEAIGRVVKDTTDATTVLVEIFPKKMLILS